MLDRIARMSANRPKRVLLGALLIAVFAGVFGLGVADRLDPYGADDPKSESIRTDKQIEALTGTQAEPAVIALVEPTTGTVADGPARDLVDEVSAVLRGDPDVRRVLSYYDTNNPAMVSQDGRSTYVLAFLAPGSDREHKDAAERIEDELSGMDGVELGGIGPAQAQVNDQVSEDLAKAELIAMPLLLLLSFVFFRGLVAAALPPLIGGLAIVLTFASLRVASEFGSISVFALNLVTGLGLGLAIDYSLFIVSRYREELAQEGATTASALRITLATAGRTVLFSGLTVAGALASMLVFPQRFLYSMGIGGVLVSLIAVSVALLVLPAILVLLGHRVNSLAPKRLQRAREHDATTNENGFWYRLSHFVMRRPGRVAVVTTLGLVLIASPVAGITFNVVSAGVLPESASARQVDDAIEERFGATAAHETEPIRILIADAPGPEVDAFLDEVRGIDGIARVGGPQQIGPDRTLASAVASDEYLTDGAQDAVREIRDLDAPFDVGVAGLTAEFIDLKVSLLDHLPWTLLVVVVATMVLLFLMTGSVVLPIKSLIMNVLTVGATLGILVWIFQDGRFEGMLDYTSEGALEMTQPILLSIIAFGLATDYSVFLLSRIKEARDSGLSDSEAVAVGVERTGRIVTAAAVLFAVAVGAFATSQIIFIKQFGTGTAIAVLIDATIIRALLVPALMQLLGRRNWWAPKPLRRLHDRFGISESGPLRGIPAGPAGPEGPEGVEGRVLDVDGAPLAGVTVTLTGPAAPGGVSAVTGAAGEYRLPAPTGGPHLVVFARTRFRPHAEWVGVDGLPHPETTVLEPLGLVPITPQLAASQPAKWTIS